MLNKWRDQGYKLNYGSDYIRKYINIYKNNIINNNLDLDCCM